MDTNNDEIDLFELLKKIWKGRKKIVLFIAIFGVFGILSVLFSSKKYTASCTFITQNSASKVAGGLGSLASLAGINLGTSPTEEISQDLYPEVVQSVSFLREIVKTSVQTQKQKEPISFDEYCQKYPPKNVLGSVKKYTIGLPSTIIEAFKGDTKKEEKVISQNEIINISPSEEVIFSTLKNQLSLQVNSKKNSIVLSFSAEEPLLAAQMAQSALVHLQNTITQYKLRKAQDKLDFIQKRYEEAQKDFKEKQMRLASFQDSNRGLIALLPQTRQSQLESEYNIAYGVYSELAKQLETQKIQVKEDTPIFTIIEPVSIPLQKSGMSSVVVIVIWTFLGGILGVFSVLAKDFLKTFRSRLKEKNIEEA